MTRKISTKVLAKIVDKKPRPGFRDAPKKKGSFIEKIKKAGSVTISKPYKRLNPDKRVIHHLTQTDAYKYSQGQFLKHRWSNEYTEWEFKLRTKGVDITYLYEDIVKEIDHLCTLRYTKWELDGIRKVLPWLTEDFIEWLEEFQLKRKYITVTKDLGVNGGIVIKATGPEVQVQWFEIYVLQIVQHLYFADEEFYWETAKANLAEVIRKWNEAYRSGIKFTVSDFGIRRGVCDEWDEYMVKTLLECCPAFVGTSNVYLAIKLGCKAIGTFAHQLYALYQGIRGICLEDAQWRVLEDWVKEFRGDLGIALSDNYGFAAFLRDFDKYYMKLYDGCRHDSGDPIKWGELLIAHYLRAKIDPRTKTGCWSDSLDADKALEIAKHFNGRINVAFGIGTFLSATICGMRKAPLSMVMKVIKVNGKDVAKVSDSASKGMCHDQSVVENIKRVFRYVSIDDKTIEELQEIIYGMPVAA